MTENKPAPSPSRKRTINQDATVMVVSNQASTRMNIERYLSGYFQRAYSASSGRDALEKDKSNMVTVLVVDTALPDMGIQEFLAKIRQHRNMVRDVIECYHAKVLLITAPNENLDMRILRRLGVLDRIAKPVNIDAFGRLVSKMLSGEYQQEEESITNIGILDPETRAREFLVRTLQADDVQIMPMTDVFDAYGAVSGARLDILILETIGVGDDAMVFLKEMKTRSPNTRMIICTAFHDKDMNQQYLDFGVAAVFTKPVNLIGLRRKVREIMGEIHESTPNNP